MTERLYGDQYAAVANEGATPGTDPAANYFEPVGTDFMLGRNMPRRVGRSVGHWFSQYTARGREQSTSAVNSAAPTFQEIGLIFTLIFGAPTTTGAGPYTHVWRPKVKGRNNPHTFTILNLDADNLNKARRATNAFLSDLTFNWATDNNSASGTLLAAAIETGVDKSAITTSQYGATRQPIDPQQWDLYIDSTSGSLGSSIFDFVDAANFRVQNFAGPWYTIRSRANRGFKKPVNMTPTAQLTLTPAADIVSGTVDFLALARANTRKYVELLNTSDQMAGSTIPYSLNMQFAVEVGNLGDYKDSQGVFAEDVPLEIVEDSAWGSGGSAFKITLVNNVANYVPNA